MEISERRGLPGLAYPEEYLKRLAAELSDQFDGVRRVRDEIRGLVEDLLTSLRVRT